MTSATPPAHGVPDPASSPQGLVRYEGEGLDRARGWVAMGDGERKRRAMEAAVTRDADELLSLAESWLLLHGRREGQTRPLTVAAYRQGIRALLTAWRTTPLLTATGNDAALWLRRIQGREGAPAKASTLIRYRAAGRALYRALRWAGATTADPFADARVASDPTPVDERRHPYDSAAVERLIAHATGDDLVLVLLGAHAGLRVAEALALTWGDVALDAAQLTVVSGKGGKRRTVALSASLVAALYTLLQTGERTVGVQDRYVLPYRTAISARRRLQLLCQHAGVMYRGMHSLRHSAGTRLYAETHDLDTTARHLGHSSIETTRIYAKWSDKTLKTTMGTW